MPARTAARRSPSSPLALVLLSPVLLLAAIAIKLDSRGPVIYRQRRAGRDGRPFELLKLRTMRPGADPVGVGTPVLEDDPRVTRVGGVPAALLARRAAQPRSTCSAATWRSSGRARRWRRRSSSTRPHQRRRLEVEPGITGWAQVNGRAGIPWEERIELDVWYVDNRSALLDLKILAPDRAAAADRPRPLRIA